MSHSDGKLTDTIYTDENLLGVESVISLLPAFMESPSQGASQIASQMPVMGGHEVTLPVTLPALNGVVKIIENKGESHELALVGTVSHKGDEWREWRGSNP